MDDFRIYNRALSASDVASLYALGSPPPTPKADLSLSGADFRILNAAGVETWNPAIGEAVTLEVTLRNTGGAATFDDILVQAFHDGAPTDLTAYDTNDFSIVASTVVAESMGVGGSRTLLLPWTADAPDRVATLTVVAEFAANRAQSQANAEGASAALPVAEVSLANNGTGRSLQIGSPAAGDYGIEILAAPPSNMLSGVSYTLSGTARYDWEPNEPVLGASVTVTVGDHTYPAARTASPNGTWSVPLNGLPEDNHPALVQVFDGRLTGETNLALVVSSGPATIDLRVKQIAFESGTYHAVGETGYAVTGTPVVVKALVRNDGNTASGDFVVAFLDGTNATYATYTTNVPAFSERWITAPAGWPAEAGTHTLSVLADSAGEVDETNEGNNTRSFTVIGTAALPDLIVHGITFDPAVPKAGDTVTVTATIKNQGGAVLTAGASFDVLFQLDGVEIATETVTLLSDLPPGASVTVAASHTFAADGAFTVTAQADSGEVIAETDEANNSLSRTLSVRQALPDLRPFYYLYGREGWSSYYRSGLSFSPAQPVAGEAVTVFCDIYNVGTVPLAAGEAFDVTFSAGGTSFAANRVTLAADLAVGASTRTEVVWPGGAAGGTNFAVAVDLAEEIAEENESNNATAAGLTIYPNDAALIAAGLAFAPWQPLPDAPVTLTATIRNDGGAAGGAGVPAIFYVGSVAPENQIGSVPLAADIAPKGGTGTAVLEWTTPTVAGPVEVFAMIGASGTQRALTVTANPAPNLQVYSEDIAFDPPLPQSGEAVGVSATVRNTEGSTATDFQVRFFVEAPGGSPVDLGAPVSVASLAAGASTTVNATAAITAQRSAYTVKVEIEPNAAQGDANPGDNAATSSFLLADTPRADAGPDAACFVGQPVQFDGSGSTNAANHA